MKKKLGKKLALRRETVRDLTDAAVENAGGGATRYCTISTPGCICLNTNVGCDDTNALGCP